MKQIIFFQIFFLVVLHIGMLRFVKKKKKRVDFDHGLPLKKIKAYTNNKGYFIVIYFSFTRFTIIVRNANYTYCIYGSVKHSVCKKERTSQF